MPINDEQEEDDLWMELKKTKSPALREKFIKQYMPLVKYVAGKVAVGMPSSVEFDDLVGFGQFGLLDAINKYDVSKNVKFKTYAVTRIRGAIFDELRQIDWVPRSVRQKSREIEDAIENEREFTVLCFDDLTSQYNYGLGVFASDEWKGFVLFHEGYGELPFAYKEEMEDYIKWDCVWSTAECEGWREVEYKNKTYLVKEW